MSQNQAERTPARPLAAQLLPRLKRMREARGWSARELSERCAAAGYPHLTRDVLASMEMGRRVDITVDELAVLTYVLNGEPDDTAPTVSRLLMEAGVGAARTGGPRWLAEWDVWLMFSEAQLERDRLMMDAADRFRDEMAQILGYADDPAVGASHPRPELGPPDPAVLARLEARNYGSDDQDHHDSDSDSDSEEV